MGSSPKENLNFQKFVVITGIVVFFIKLLAWQLTKSISILTDTLESIINILAAFFSLCSLYISLKPKDRDHPYGHGKIEFIAAGFEGSLIMIAGIFISYEAIKNLFFTHEISKLDYGIIIIGITGIINYLLGFYTVRKGKKNKSLILISGGQHLISDSYSSLGLIIGLILIYLTHFYWIDSIVALIFAGIIIFSGIKIIRKSLAGIMDEADEELIKELVNILNKNRKVEWIDIHNVRFIKYGSSLHLDCHFTLPWYFNLKEVKKEVDDLEKIITENFGDHFEMFVHVDACQSFMCNFCNKQDCEYRMYNFKEQIKWNIKNIELNKHHNITKN